MKNLSSLFFVLVLSIFYSCSTESTPVYQLTTSAEPTEAGSVSPSNSESDEGEVVEISASANENWVFDRWQGDLSGNLNPAAVSMNKDKSITAVFIKKEYQLAVNIDGNGEIEEHVVQQKSTDYPHGTLVELTAVSDEGWEFIEWNGDLEGKENPAQIIVEDNREVTAIFKEGVFDVDDNFYNSVSIGEQNWLAKNLRTSKYSNGDAIPNVTNSEEWMSLDNGAWIYYSNNEEYDSVYGKLYNWFAVNNSDNICPEGWRVPSDDDWWVLIDYLAGEEEDYDNIGGKMKATGTEYWTDPNIGATNESGFTALPGGYYNGSSFELGALGVWWSTTEETEEDDVALERHIWYSESYIFSGFLDKNVGLSVRCIEGNSSAKYKNKAIPDERNRNINSLR